MALDLSAVRIVDNSEFLEFVHLLRERIRLNQDEGRYAEDLYELLLASARFDLLDISREPESPALTASTVVDLAELDRSFRQHAPGHRAWGLLALQYSQRGDAENTFSALMESKHALPVIDLDCPDLVGEPQRARRALARIACRTRAVTPALAAFADGLLIGNNRRTNAARASARILAGTGRLKSVIERLPPEADEILLFLGKEAALNGDTASFDLACYKHTQPQRLCSHVARARSPLQSHVIATLRSLAPSAPGLVLPLVWKAQFAEAKRVLAQCEVLHLGDAVGVGQALLILARSGHGTAPLAVLGQSCADWPADQRVRVLLRCVSEAGPFSSDMLKEARFVTSLSTKDTQRLFCKGMEAVIRATFGDETAPNDFVDICKSLATLKGEPLRNVWLNELVQAACAHGLVTEAESVLRWVKPMSAWTVSAETVMQAHANAGEVSGVRRICEQTNGKASLYPALRALRALLEGPDALPSWSPDGLLCAPDEWEVVLN